MPERKNPSAEEDLWWLFGISKQAYRRQIDKLEQVRRMQEMQMQTQRMAEEAMRAQNEQMAFDNLLETYLRSQRLGQVGVFGTAQGRPWEGWPDPNQQPMPDPAAPPQPRKERVEVSIRMPFGKHKGTPLVNLPTDYLDWVLNWMDSEESGWMSHSRRRLFDELDAEFERRKTGVRPTRVIGKAFNIDPDVRALLPEFIKSGYRAMALKVHPDKGGTAEQMVALRKLKEALEKL